MHIEYTQNGAFHTFCWIQKFIICQDLFISYLSRGEFKGFSKYSSSIGLTTELEEPRELALICVLPSWRSKAKGDICTVMEALKGIQYRPLYSRSCAAVSTVPDAGLYYGMASLPFSSIQYTVALPQNWFSVRQVESWSHWRPHRSAHHCYPAWSPKPQTFYSVLLLNGGSCNTCVIKRGITFQIWYAKHRWVQWPFCDVFVTQPLHNVLSCTLVHKIQMLSS
jgi:hypothetical protein